MLRYSSGRELCPAASHTRARIQPTAMIQSPSNTLTKGRDEGGRRAQSQKGSWCWIHKIFPSHPGSVHKHVLLSTHNCNVRHLRRQSLHYERGTTHPTVYIHLLC
ncbi:hypothetical protein BT69DRAFT_1276402 [Atractiella rhizophila]|nr:hypothetical protein BT69DRAFT_1276402 [Atractiella rhizophila]